MSKSRQEKVFRADKTFHDSMIIKLRLAAIELRVALQDYQKYNKCHNDSEAALWNNGVNVLDRTKWIEKKNGG